MNKSIEKLKEGDHVKDLTEDQFNRLCKIFSCHALTYGTSKNPSISYIGKCLVFHNSGHVSHGSYHDCKNLLSYREFLDRALYTTGKPYKSEDFKKTKKTKYLFDF